MNSRDFNPKPLKNIVKVVFCILQIIFLLLKNCLKRLKTALVQIIRPFALRCQCVLIRPNAAIRP